MRESRLRAVQGRLLPWRIYAVVGMGLLVSLPLLFTGTGFENPEAARRVGYMGVCLFLLMVLVAVTAYRNERRRRRG